MDYLDEMPMNPPRPSVRRGGAVADPKKAGDRAKTNRRDAAMPARLHRAGELTPVFVPGAGHGAMRGLIWRHGGAVRQTAPRARLPAALRARQCGRITVRMPVLSVVFPSMSLSP